MVINREGYDAASLDQMLPMNMQISVHLVGPVDAMDKVELFLCHLKKEGKSRVCYYLHSPYSMLLTTSKEIILGISRFGKIRVTEVRSKVMLLSAIFYL